MSHLPRWRRRTLCRELRQLLASLLGRLRGRHLPPERRCRQCGAPCRTSGGYRCPIYYDRNSCGNKLCQNYIPF
jgi:hypothetical protein